MCFSSQLDWLEEKDWPSRSYTSAHSTIYWRCVGKIVKSVRCFHVVVNSDTAFL